MQSNIILTTFSASRNLLRTYARRVAHKKSVSNPGIQKRVTMLKNEDQSNLDQLDIDDLEANFMNVHEMHREFENESVDYKEKMKYWIVKQRYFKETKINFLTWNDKEQIRYLHQTDPEEWTFEKLSEGFPALPETIAKIVKGKWHVKKEMRKENHDKAVEENWKLLKEGKLSEVLPENLVSHLIKFSSRQSNQILIENKIVINDSKRNKSPINNEFSSIITNYESLKNKSSNDKHIEKHKFISDNHENNLVNNMNKTDRKQITLSMFKESENLESINSEVNIPNDNVLLKEEIKVETKPVIKDVNKINNKYVVKYENSKQQSEIITYPERIKIPKDKFKKGFTYKVNDCYYDDDGEFLYRVPGMY